MNEDIYSRIHRRLTSAKRNGYHAWLFPLVCVLVALATPIALMRRGIATTHTEQVLACHYEGVAAHTHGPECYDDERNLACPLPERALHQHGPECYDDGGNLICGQEEVLEEHVHGPGCFTTVEVEDGEDAADATDGDGIDGEDSSADSRPAQTFAQTLLDQNQMPVLTVDVAAPEGALPQGATMQVSLVSQADLSEGEMAAVSDALAQETDGKLVELQGVDLRFFDAEGNEIQPEAELVIMLTSDLLNTNDQPFMLRVDDLTRAQQGAMAAGQAEPDRTAAVVDELDETRLTEHNLVLETNQLAFASKEPACRRYDEFGLMR